MNALLLVVVGAGIGGGLRHLVNIGAARLLGIHFPWGTLTVNLVGSFVMGLLAAWFALRFSGGGQALRLLLTTGILGGFTTFSSFSLDAVLLWERGATGVAALYVAVSVAVGIAALVAGLALGRAFG
ncbi:MAG TPA: fluoride efflux transporter CrcB [Hyphomicrobiales bacterium]|nr:fluoride efflux transporter CrcB [Hyphomicrobiales bacterium]